MMQCAPKLRCVLCIKNVSFFSPESLLSSTKGCIHRLIFLMDDLSFFTYAILARPPKRPFLDPTISQLLADRFRHSKRHSVGRKYRKPFYYTLSVPMQEQNIFTKYFVNCVVLAKFRQVHKKHYSLTSVILETRGNYKYQKKKT